MSTIEEQYQAAARQKRTLDSPHYPGEYIATQPSWQCKCGNTPEAQGFHLWNRKAWRYAETEAEAIASTPGYGPTWYYRCDRCFRTIVGPQGYVTDPPLMVRDVWGATFTATVDCADCGEETDAPVYFMGTSARCPECHATRIAPEACDEACEDDHHTPRNRCRDLNAHERAAIYLDCDVQAFKAGQSNARAAVAAYGLAYVEDYARRLEPWTDQPHHRGFVSELAEIRREHLEAIHGICADCETPLENGKYCPRCIEG